MPVKTFSIRISSSAPDVDSAKISTWIDEFLSAPGSLAADPGAGDRTMRPSLDADKVKAAAKVAAEPETVFLRRLIASNVTISTEPAPAAEPKPKAPILRGNLKLRAEQVLPLVSAFEGTQSYVIRKTLRAPEAIKEAALTADERDRLAINITEVLNRRAPAALVERVDLLGLGLDLVSISWRKVDAVRAFAEDKRRKRAGATAASAPTASPVPDSFQASDLAGIE